MTALLEYLDLTVLLEYIDLLNRYSGALHGASWGPFQAGARGKMPQLPPPLWAALDAVNVNKIVIVSSTKQPSYAYEQVTARLKLYLG